MFDKQRFNLTSISESWTGDYGSINSYKQEQAAFGVLYVSTRGKASCCILALPCVLANCVHRPSATLCIGITCDTCHR